MLASSRFLGISVGWLGSPAGVLARCMAQLQSLCACYRYWLVIAEFTPGPPPPSWHGKNEVSILVSTVLSV